MPAPDMQARWRRLFEATGVEPENWMLRVVSREMQPFEDMPNLGEAAGQAAISGKIGDARVIILDNLSPLIHGAKGRTLIFIHHAGKGGG